MDPYTIRIFLPDGRPTGIQLAEIMNWTGKALVAQRSELKNLADRPEIREMGVYFLIGKSTDGFDQDVIYVGEGKVWERLTQHDNNKDFWTRVICFVSKDKNLTKGHVQYLESLLVRKIQETGREILENTQKTQPGYTCIDTLPESERADMNSFLRHIEMVLPVLGCNVLKPKPQTHSSSKTSGSDTQVTENEESPLFEIHRSGTCAFAKEVNGEFIVLKDSTARKQATPSWLSYAKFRDQLVEEGKLIDSDNPKFYRFTEDVVFNSPSAVANMVTASHVNGRVAWWVQGTKKTYDDWQAEQLAAAEQLADADAVQMPPYLGGM